MSAAEKPDAAAEAADSPDASTVARDKPGPLKMPYNEIYHLGLVSQPNIYCCCKIDAVGNAKEKVLVGSLNGKVSCVDCSSPRGSAAHQLHSNEVYFTYIPGDAEIVSLDAFVKQTQENDVKTYSLVVGISLVLLKNPSNFGGSRDKRFLNVYSSVHPEANPTLESVAGICQHIELDFTPYQLTHTRVALVAGEETVAFLLSGSDRKVHLFAEDRELCKFVERDIDGYFPEFVNLPSNVTWMDIRRCRESIRVTALGCENGYIRYCAVDESKQAVLTLHDTDIDGPALSVKLFPLHGACTSANDLKTMDLDTIKTWESSPLLCQYESLQMLVTSALDLCVVFRSPHKAAFSDVIVLPQSDYHDSVTCSLICDVDCDGNNEIVLGTYGQELLVYRWHCDTGDTDAIHFDLVWHWSFAQPIFALNQLDLLGDGMTELVVATMTSVHILQRDVNSSVSMLIDKLIGIALPKGSISSDQLEDCNEPSPVQTQVQ